MLSPAAEENFDLSRARHSYALRKGPRVRHIRPRPRWLLTLTPVASLPTKGGRSKCSLSLTLAGVGWYDDVFHTIIARSAQATS